METTIPRYLTEKEVAKMTGLSLSTLRSHRFNNKGMPYCKLERAVRYKLSDVIVYLEERTIQTADSVQYVDEGKIIN